MRTRATGLADVSGIDECPDLAAALELRDAFRRGKVQLEGLTDCDGSSVISTRPAGSFVGGPL